MDGLQPSELGLENRVQPTPAQLQMLSTTNCRLKSMQLEACKRLHCFVMTVPAFLCCIFPRERNSLPSTLPSFIKRHPNTVSCQGQKEPQAAGLRVSSCAFQQSFAFPPIYKCLTDSHSLVGPDV